MGYPEETYVKKARDMTLTPFITFTGRIDYRQAPDYLNLGDLAVSPKLSKTEANGKLYDYISCGLPTVVFDSEINREILGDLGVYATFGDASDLAEKMMGLISDSETLQDLGSRLRAKTVSEYSWAKNSEKIVQIYENLLQKQAYESNNRNRKDKVRSLWSR
jgi:glycosyltransferase involved in cell wall biosynthesis